MGNPVRRRLVFLAVGNLILLALIFSFLKEGSSFREVLERIGPDIAPVGLAGYALTGIIFTGAIDLSIASMLVLAGTVFSCVVTRGMPALPAFVICAATAWALMSFNGVVVSKLNMPAIIVTLAGLPFYRGIALIVADTFVPNFSGNISVLEDVYHAPGKYYGGAILLAGTIAALLLEGFSKFPRLWLALGNSAEACNLMGLKPRRILASAFFVAGIFFAAATLVYVTRVQAVEPARMALGFELQVIAAVILGGTNIFGGEGSYLGTLLGGLFLYLISQVLIYIGANVYLQDALTGAIILAIIGADCALHRKAKLMEELA
jgi:ribose/xylose/arabinose/galactoside ABC-type transport system permease subunit